MLRLLITGFVSLALTASPALAAGGGGGGGGYGSSPSASAPNFDPVKTYQKGLEQLQAKDYKAAERSFKKVADIAKTDGNTHYMLALAQLGQDKWQPAAKSLAKAVKYEPGLIDARMRLGLVELQNAKPDVAKTQLAALKDMQTTCAASCADASALTEAIKSLEAALAAPSAPAKKSSALPAGIQPANAAAGDAAYFEAVRLINLQHYDAAIETLEVAQAAFGPHPDVLTYIGFANRKQGRAEDALRFYQAALSVAPGHRGANEYLGEYYVEQGDLVSARRQLEIVEASCAFGCEEARELKAWIDAAEAL